MIELDYPKKDGTTWREHLEQLEKYVGRPQIEESEPPKGVEYVFKWFFSLNRCRGSNGFALLPLGYSELQAWSRLTRTELAPWEAEALIAMDETYRATVAKMAEESNG